MRAGDRLLTYIVERELGEGGMGTVYLGRHTVLNQQVAIKVLSPLLARDKALRERFIQEANIQAGLRHPGIVQVLTAEMEGEQPSLVMEYIEGKSLSEVLEMRGALPVEDALKIMEQVLSAVGYAHRQGVIHRDLKPSNVMVMATGEAKVTDFGIAKVLGSSKLTRTGAAMGSAHYMSPEQIRRPEAVDASSDIYSLGCVFYEVLTGRPPFGEADASGTESDYEVKTAHVTEAVPAFETVKSGIPAWLATLVTSMLEKEPDQRPSSCEAIVAALEGGRNVENTQIIQGNKKPDWGQTESGRHDFYEDPHKPLEASSADSKTDKSRKNAVLTVAVLFAIVGPIVFKLGSDTPTDRQEPAASVGVSTPIHEQKANNVRPTASVEVSTPIHEQKANNVRRRAEQLALKIEAGNPNNKEPCPQDKNARHHNCWGTYIFADGDQYAGRFTIGDTYVGEFKDGLAHGLGAYTFQNGDKYVGEFKADFLYGLGTYFSATDTYVGEWRGGKFHGQGTDIFATGDKYVGEFKDHRKNGRGTYTLADGSKYVGEWKDGHFNGLGIKYRVDGSIEESGHFQKGKIIKYEYVDPSIFTRIAK